MSAILKFSEDQLMMRLVRAASFEWWGTPDGWFVNGMGPCWFARIPEGAD